MGKIEENNKIRIRCHIDHVYTDEDLSMKQSESIEATLWIAPRMMEEWRQFLNNISIKNRKKGFVRIAVENERASKELGEQIDRLKNMLINTQLSNVQLTD